MSTIERDLADSGLVTADTSQFILPGGMYSKDGDTFGLADGRALRLQGVNTGETQKIGRKASDWEAADLGADTQQAMVRKIMLDNGFDTPTFTGQKDEHGREIGDIINKSTGKSLTEFMIKNRIADPMMPTQDQVAQGAMGDLQRAQRKHSGMAATIGDSMMEILNAERNQFPLMAKPYANSAREYGASMEGGSDSRYYAGAGYIRNDENYKGEARSNLKTGLEMSANSVEQALYNVADMFGRSTGNEFIQSWGEQRSAMIGNHMANLPALRSGEALDEDGNWKLDSFSEVADYLVGTAASSAPQMLLSIGATLAAPMTYGVSLSFPAAIYAGQTFQNQTVKNPGTALMSGIAQSAIESLGVTGAFSNIFSKPAREKIIGQLMSKGMSKYEAEQLFISKSKDAIQEVFEASKVVQGGLLKRVAKATSAGITHEAPEEMGQELVQYFGEQSKIALPSEVGDQVKLMNRILNAGIGGAALGGGIGGTMAAGKYVSEKPIFEQSSDVNFRNQFNGVTPTSRSIIEEAQSNVADINNPPSLADLKSSEDFKRSSSGALGGVLNWAKDKGVSSLFGKWANVVVGETGHSGKFSAALATLLGANKALNGGSIEEQQGQVTNAIQKSFGSAQDIKHDFNMPMHGVNAILSDPKVHEAIGEIIGSMEAMGDTNTSNAVDVLTTNGTLKGLLGTNMAHVAAIGKYADRVNKLVNAYNEKTGSKLTAENFMRLKPVNKNAVQNNQEAFVDLLVKHLGVSSADARIATKKILGDPTAVFISDPFEDLFSDNPNTALIRDNLEKLLNNPSMAGVFNKFLNRDLNENAYGLAAKGGASYVHKNLIGKDGSHLAALLEQATKNNEISPEQASFMAKEITDWLDMRNGTFHQITNQYYNGAMSLINFLSTITALPLAAISSTVEFAQVYRHLTTGQAMKATYGLLHGFGAEFMGVVAHLGRTKSAMADTYHNKLFEQGFMSRGDIGRRNDVVTGYYQKWTEGFFKLTGLTSVTNITRYAKMSIGEDAMKSWLNTVKNADVNNPSQAAIDAREHLVRIGVDVETMIRDDVPPEKVSMEYTNGIHNFVTEAVVHPTKMNRPKFYSDPYLQLFTQFMGYTSTFTANVIPLLVKDLGGKSSVKQVNAASAIAMMMALTFVALLIKDTIKYGESPPEWLKEEKKFQRYIGQSGILGSGQRIWDTVSPVMSKTTNQGSLASAIKQVTDQAPALSYVNNVLGALDAQPGQKTKAAARVLPIFGTSPAFAKYLQEELGDL